MKIVLASRWLVLLRYLSTLPLAPWRKPDRGMHTSQLSLSFSTSLSKPLPFFSSLFVNDSTRCKLHVCSASVTISETMRRFIDRNSQNSHFRDSKELKKKNLRGFSLFLPFHSTPLVTKFFPLCLARKNLGENCSKIGTSTWNFLREKFSLHPGEVGGLEIGLKRACERAEREGRGDR